jgi:4-hydroxythreonine-4-phosphate dehydrogenase
MAIRGDLSPMNERKPTIGVLLGDPSGIGPEVGVRLLCRAQNTAKANVVLFADRHVLAAGERVADSQVSLGPSPSEGVVALRALDLIGASDIIVGQSNVLSGTASFRALADAAQAALRGEIDGVVFAPLNKHSLRLGGMQADDELRYLQELFGVTGFVCEFNVTGALWTSRVTSHIPLKDVAAAITVDRVCGAVRIIHATLLDAGIANPTIGVAGLNPHAGDGGSIGQEEIDIIAPAVKAMQREGIDARGPYPADTIFVSARKGAMHGIVSMYHDQGQIAMKLMGFDHGVTVLGGLPVPFTTCASGSAFDIAGKGIANVEGLQNAFDLCVTMAARRGAHAA